MATIARARWWFALAGLALCQGVWAETDLPPAELSPYVFATTLDINEVTRAQYAGAVSMAMEGMRLVYGDMSPEEEQQFEAQWMGLFAHPDAQVIAYLNELNPLLGQFLAIRDTLNQTLAAYQSNLFELAVALSDDHDEYLRELVVAHHFIVASMHRLNDQLNAVIQAILALGEPPDATETRRTRHKEHEESLLVLHALAHGQAQPQIEVFPASLVTSPGLEPVLQARVTHAPEHARLRWRFFHEGREVGHQDTAIDAALKLPRWFIHVDKPDSAVRVELFVVTNRQREDRNLPDSGPTLAHTIVPVRFEHQQGQWVLVDRVAIRVCSTEFVNSAREAGFTGAPGSTNEDLLIYARQETTVEDCHTRLSFLNPAADRGWRVSFWWTAPPVRLVPGETVQLQVRSRMDFVGGPDMVPRGGKTISLPNGEITARLSRIRPWAERDDMQYNAQARARASVDVRTVTDEQWLVDVAAPTTSSNTEATVPRPYVMQDFGARSPIDPTGQVLLLEVASTSIYHGIRYAARGDHSYNRLTVHYLYRWDPTGSTFVAFGQTPEQLQAEAGDEQDPAIAAAQQEAMVRAAQVAFHRANSEHFEDSVRELTMRLRQAGDARDRDLMHRDLLYQQDALQREQDAIATLMTGNFVRTRTDLDELNARMMLEYGRAMAEDADTVQRAFERIPRVLALADEADREILTNFAHRHLHGEDQPLDAQRARQLMRIVSHRVGGHLEQEAAGAALEAIDAAERLHFVQNVKTVCDTSLMLLSTFAPVYHAYAAPNLVAAGMRARKVSQMYMVYQGTTGFIEGGVTKAFTSVASSYNTVTKLAHAGMEGYQRGVLDHLHQHAQDPTGVTLDEHSAGLYGATWQVGVEALKAYVTKKVVSGLMPPQEPQAPVRKWPTIEEQVREARFQSRQANGRATVRLFQQRAGRLADAGKAGAPREDILRLRQSMNEAYVAVKSDYFAKMHINKLACQGDTKTTHYYNSSERQYSNQLLHAVERRMDQAGFNPQSYTKFSNSASAGKVGMDLDLGVVEPPRYITRDGVRVPNPQHIAWRRNITQTLPDGTVVHRSPHQLQVAGNEALHAAYEEVYGREPGEAMIAFTSSYHPEAYRDVAWLGRKGSKTAMIHDTDPFWTQQAADVTGFKINHLPRDHPSLGHYGLLQEQSRGLVKDYDTKIWPMVEGQNDVNLRALQHSRQLRNVMDRFARDEIGPIEADSEIRLLTGGRGIEEVSDQFAVLMRGLRSTLTSE